MSERPCRCGHLLGDHYLYQLNGRNQTRCRSCDPHTGKRMPGLYAMPPSDSFETAMYFAADHDFELVEDDPTTEHEPTVEGGY